MFFRLWENKKKGKKRKGGFLCYYYYYPLAGWDFAVLFHCFLFNIHLSQSINWSKATQLEWEIDIRNEFHLGILEHWKWNGIH